MLKLKPSTKKLTLIEEKIQLEKIKLFIINKVIHLFLRGFPRTNLAGCLFPVGVSQGQCFGLRFSS